MASEMVEWVERKIGPPATILEKAENVKEFMDNNDVVVVGFFSDPESEAAKQYKEAVRDYEEYPCGITSDMEAAAKHDVSSQPIRLRSVKKRIQKEPIRFQSVFFQNKN